MKQTFEHTIRFEYTNHVSFTVPGNAVTKSNQSMIGKNQKTGRPLIFTPKKYKDYEKSVRQIAKQVMAQVKLAPFEGDSIVRLNFYYDTRRKRDLQNLPKSVCDALNDLVYQDDSQIKQIFDMNKYYDKENPRVEVDVFETNIRWYETPLNEQLKK